MKAIHLIAVVRYSLLKEYGFEAVLKPFIKDMNELRKVAYLLMETRTVWVCFDLQGCLLKINDKELLVKGAVLADTQAAHAIGGFKIGVGFSLKKVQELPCN